MRRELSLPLRGALLIPFVLGLIAIHGSDQRCAGDFGPRNSLRESCTLHVNAGIIQLDVNCEQTELRVKMGAHTAGNRIELEESSTTCNSRSFNHANSVAAHARK